MQMAHKTTPPHYQKGPETPCIQEQDRSTTWFQLQEQCKGLDDIQHLPRVATGLGPGSQA